MSRAKEQSIKFGDDPYYYPDSSSAEYEEVSSRDCLHEK